MSVCPNCEHILKPEDNFCPNCGQENHDLKIPLSHLIYEFIENIFHFDIKVWETLKVSFLSPGLLTKNFNEGKRNRYVPPARLYVFISVIFFFLLNYVFDKSLENRIEKNIFSKESIIHIDFQELDFSNKELFEVAVRRRANAGITIPPKQKNPEATLKQELTQKISQNFDRAINNGYLDSTSQLASFIHLQLQDSLSRYIKDSIVTRLDNDSLTVRMVSPINQLQRDSVTAVKWLNNDDFISSKAQQLNKNNKTFGTEIVKTLMTFEMSSKYDTRTAFKERISDLSHKILKYFSLAMFVLMPIVALILKLLYFRKTYYYENFIFSIYHHAFAFIWFSILIGLQQIFDSQWLSLIFTGAFFVYILFALKTHYGENWLRSVFKYFMLGTLYFLVFAIIAGGIIVAGLL